MTAAISMPRQRRHGRAAVHHPHVGPVAAASLVQQARQGLSTAMRETQPAQRYAVAHLAALRAAAAVLALRTRPNPVRPRPVSVWVLLAQAAPELTEWAHYFAAGTQCRISVQAGITRLVNQQTADDLLRNVDIFVRLVDRILAEG